MNILVTGRNGLLGAELINFLRTSDHNVDGISTDLRNLKHLEAFTNTYSRIDWIIHTSAITDTNLCERNRNLCFDFNILRTRNIRNIAHKKKSKLIFTSTASVFSGKEGNYKEQDIPYPINFYNLSKFVGEQLVLDYNDGLVLRINLIGFHRIKPRNLNFFEWLIEAFKKNRDINLYKDVYINPLSNITLSQQIENLIKINPKEKILHLGSANVLSKAAIGKIVLNKFPKFKGIAKFINHSKKENGVHFPLKIGLNVDYVQNKLGIKMPTLESEIDLLMNNL